MALRLSPGFEFAVHLLLSASQVAAEDGNNRSWYSSKSIETGPFNHTNEVDSASYHKIVIVHAVLACLVWVLFTPLGAIFLRSDMRGVNLLKLHAYWQLFVYTMCVTAVGLGIWMRLQLSINGAVWRYPHASIGLLMLIGAFFQPWLGYIHHKIFNRRLNAINTGDTTEKLGRTVITHLHLWLGRLLITLGVINGGLGIMVTWDRGSLYQPSEASKTAAIAYGVIAGTLFLMYAGFMFRHEYRRAPLIMNTRDRDSSMERSSDVSDKSVQSIEIGRRFSVFVDDVLELTERRGRSNEKLISGWHTPGHSPRVSPMGLHEKLTASSLQSVRSLKTTTSPHQHSKRSMLQQIS